MCRSYDKMGFRVGITAGELAVPVVYHVIFCPWFSMLGISG
jgi:hypothetical protein